MSEEFEPYDEEAPSKSQRKRDMHALQKMGEELIALNNTQLATFKLPEELQRAIVEMHRITKNEARRRHLQFIGKLMRTVDAESIRDGLDALQAKSHSQIQHQHLVEQWRDRLIAGEVNALETFITQYGDIDRQHLRQLIRQAQQEQSHNKPPAHARKLFRYIRDFISE
ncbi:MAG TPA: ribosome biogenesis factor YjgA [Cellvibrionaceae bacterium]